MKRADVIRYHEEEAESAIRWAATSAGPAKAQLEEAAADHRYAAEAARTGTYEPVFSPTGNWTIRG